MSRDCYQCLINIISTLFAVKYTACCLTVNDKFSGPPLDLIDLTIITTKKKNLVLNVCCPCCNNGQNILMPSDTRIEPKLVMVVKASHAAIFHATI
jgi:hypothetical protein